MASNICYVCKFNPVFINRKTDTLNYTWRKRIWNNFLAYLHLPLSVFLGKKYHLVEVLNNDIANPK